MSTGSGGGEGEISRQIQNLLCANTALVAGFQDDFRAVIGRKGVKVAKRAASVSGGKLNLKSHGLE